MSAKNQSQFKPILLIALTLLLFLLVSAQAQAQDTTVNKEDILELDDTVAPPNTADEQRSSLQENQEARPAQRPQKNVVPDHTSNTSSAAPRWKPYAEIQRMHRDMHRMHDRHLNQSRNNPGFQRHFRLSTSTPEIDVKQNDHQYIVLVNLPGADKNDISVTLNGQRLTIKGKRNYKKQSRNPRGNIIFQERQSARFQRSISLPEPVYQNKMKTRLDNGILKILIPKITNGR